MHPHGDADTTHLLRSEVAELEHHARSLPPGTLRHDVTNAVGAARNALALLEDEPDAVDPAHFLEIARRNIASARGLLNGQSASGGNQRDDLGRSGEGDHRDTFGL